MNSQVVSIEVSQGRAQFFTATLFAHLAAQIFTVPPGFGMNFESNHQALMMNLQNEDGVEVITAKILADFLTESSLECLAFLIASREVDPLTLNFEGVDLMGVVEARTGSEIADSIGEDLCSGFADLIELATNLEAGIVVFCVSLYPRGKSLKISRLKPVTLGAHESVFPSINASFLPFMAGNPSIRPLGQVAEVGAKDYCITVSVECSSGPLLTA